MLMITNSIYFSDLISKIRITITITITVKFNVYNIYKIHQLASSQYQECMIYLDLTGV